MISFPASKGDPQVPVQAQPLRFQRSDLDVCTLTPFSVVRGPGCGQIGGGGRLFGMLVVNMGWLGSVSYSVWKRSLPHLGLAISRTSCVKEDIQILPS